MKKTFVLGLVSILVAAGLFGFINYSSEKANAVGTSIPSQMIVANTTWNASGSPYYIEGSISIASNATLAIEEGVQVRFNGDYGIFVNGNLSAIGTESSIVQFQSNKTQGKPGDWSMIWVNSTGHLELKHCELVNGNLSVYLMGSSGNVIENCTITDSAQDGISLYMASNNLISNSTFDSNGDDGIYLYSSPNNKIINPRLLSNKGDGMVIVDSNDVYVENCYAESNGEAGIFLTYSSGATITGCDMTGNVWGIYASYSNDNNILDLNATGGKYGIFMVYSDGNIIQDSSTVGNENGTHLEYSDNNTIRDSIISSNSVDGLRLLTSDYNEIKNCTISSNGDSGIMIREYAPSESSTNNVIRNSTVSYNLNGVYLRYSNNGRVENSVISYNSNGLFLFYSSGNTIKNNRIHTNTPNAIGLITATTNSITYNDVYENEYGIILQSGSDNNWIHHNTVTNNTFQAYNNISNSHWDDGFEGNYWSDYNGTDADENGIGDQPYPIHYDAEDNYPLVNTVNLPLKVESTIPQDLSTNVLLSTKITITFSRPVDTDTVVGNISISHGAQILLYEWSGGDKILVLTLTQLAAETNYTVAVKTNIKDKAGKHLLFLFVFSFETQKAAPGNGDGDHQGPSEEQEGGINDILFSILIFSLQAAAFIIIFAFLFSRRSPKKTEKIDRKIKKNKKRKRGLS